ncbi:hypothetical protein B0H17DRAFT_1138694 [Mycena rosella]|uniref:Uncharacterized protein n=1 Tax=Mycena rosella TaxID=1033263 RepID=A0AAD7D617_MYCRO|nr:hypothetical protein B0H17DRAFT_1138694 [Mycena rosella]
MLTTIAAPQLLLPSSLNHCHHLGRSSPGIMVKTKRAAASSEKALNAASIASGEAREAEQPKKCSLGRGSKNTKVKAPEPSGAPEEPEDELATDDRDTDKIVIE